MKDKWKKSDWKLNEKIKKKNKEKKLKNKWMEQELKIWKEKRIKSKLKTTRMTNN